jgi:riboflavin biosynthesis pyrimidine reductase
VIETYAGDVVELVRRIGDRGYTHTWLLGGGDLAGQFLAADLLDELILTVAPTFVGQGPALADGEFPLRRFALTEVGQWSENGARLRYERAR